MRAKIKRILVLILVCALVINSDTAYLAMGINMLFVNATESEVIDENTDVVIDETVEDDKPVIDEEPVEGDEPATDEEPTEGDEPVTDEEPTEGDEPVTDEEPVEDDEPIIDEEDVEEKELTQPKTIDELLAILDTVPPEATLESQLAFLGADMNGVNIQNLTMAEIMALINVDISGIDLSAVTVEGIQNGDYTLYDILAMVQLRKNEQLQTLAPTSAIPTNATELAGLSTTFTLSTYQDLINLQKLSRTTSLEGYTFTFLKILDEENQALWNFSKANVDGNGYIGLGNETFPFKGTLNTYVKGMVCTINKPVCNYVSTGACFEGFNFNVNGASASIGQYLVTEEGSASQSVNFNNIVVGGTVGNNSTAVAGGLFAYVENKTTAPIVLELGENSSDTTYSVKISAQVNGSYAGGVIGTVNSEETSTGPVQIINKMSVVSGTVSGKGNAAGGIVGKIGQNVTFTMDTASFSATVNGNGDNGGAVGLVEKATFTTSTAMTLATKVSLATSVKDKGAGGLIGKTVDATKVSVENVTLNGTTILATPYNNYNVATYTGGIIGFWNDTDATARTSMDDAAFKNITVQASTIDGYDKAGVIGSIVGDNLIIDTVIVDNTTKIGANANGLAGGVVARIRGRNIEIKNSNVAASQICGTVRGGVIGGMEGVNAGVDPAGYDTLIKVTNATVTTNFSTGGVNANTGGIVGRVQRGGLLNLCGTINMQAPDLGGGSYIGYIAGDVESSLIYFEDSTVRETYEANRLAVANIYDNVGTYSGVLENVNGLLVYDAVAGKNVTGTVAGTGTEADPYKLTCKEDMMRLAIVLNTDGAFGADCFGVTANPAGATQLRSAHFEITNSIDLTGTGIYDLSRNDKAAENYAFMGSFVGENADITIIMDSHDTNQAHIGLFPYVKNATFKNLTIKTAVNGDGTSRPWRYARHGAGIAPYANGNITLDNVKTQVHFVGRQDFTAYYYGGMFGTITLNTIAGNTLTTNNIVLNSTIENVQRAKYVGGLAGRVYANANNVGANIKLNGTTTVSNKFTFSGDYANTVSAAGGLIGDIVTANATTSTYITLDAEDIQIHNQIMDYSATTKLFTNAAVDNNDVGAGGLLGHYWENIEADFKKITITGDDTKLLAPTATARFGGLIGKASGKIYFHDVAMNSGVFSNAVNGSGLLVAHGKNLLCMLDKYTIDANKVTIEACPTYFDEIVGCTVQTWDRVGGIVSIKSDGFKNMTSAGYVNQVLPATKTNQFTRYYYNLFEQSPLEYTEGMIENNVLDTPAKLMIWHLNQYAQNGYNRYVKVYFGTGSNSGTNGISRTISGTIDLRGYSYYPTANYTATLTGVNNAKIIFGGDELAQLESGNRPATAAHQQNYRMQSGLLYAPSGPIISDITFAGSISNMGVGSGAIASGSCGHLTLNNITADNLHVTDYNGSAHQVGLLLSIVVNSANVKLNGITVKGYDDSIYGQGAGAQAKYAASALIGTVGGSNNTSIKISFSNMQVPYVKIKENVTEAPVTTESPFRYASFIDKYEYTTNMDLYTGQGIYLFTQAEYNAKTVTLGKEIHYGLMYDDNTNSLPTNVLNEATDNYLPYVCDTCSQTTIQVNPKRGDLLEGCGTYEDPYVLKNAKQIFQLYQYLSPKSVGNDTYLSGWKVNQLGVHNTHIETTYGEDTFPTRDELRCAYYVVTADIDLTVISDVNDYVVSNDFDGIGSSSYPFAGVIFGKDGNQYEITLPGHDKGRIKTNYGLFNVLKGAVVKDLHITTLTPADPESTKKDDVYINQFGGSVAAKIVGGDNIIDNVKVSTELSAYATGTLLGGYVGLVEKGGLIIRNLKTDNLTSFNPLIRSGNNYIANTTNNVSAIAGKVQDGYILYEGMVNGAADTTKKVLVAADFGFGTDDLELSKTFQMVNGGYLDAKVSSDKIQITVDDATKTSQVVLADSNDAQLEIVALALNSDGLSSYGQVNATNYNGYDEKAVCRKAAYSDMGSGGTADEQIANNYDALYSFPYLVYKYFDINGEESTVQYSDLYKEVDIVVNNQTKTINVSKLNKLPGITDYTTTYYLTGGTYDMQGYQYAFRGLGELYDTTPTVTTDVWYSRFNANFDGGNSTVIANLNVDYDSAILSIGLFNNLDSSDYCLDYEDVNAQTLSIQNLIVEGSYINNYGNGNDGRLVGAVAGSIYGNWTFDNITLLGTEVQSKVTAGGIAGKVMNDTTYAAYNANNPQYAYRFVNCKLSEKTDGLTISRTTISANSGSAGGLLGIVSTGNNDTFWQGGIIECIGTQTDGLDVFSNTGAAGGLIGLVSNIIESEIIVDNNTITNTSVVIKGNGRSAGGVIGVYIPVPLTGNVRTIVHTLTVKNTTISDSVISAATNYSASVLNGVGGLVGLINPRAASSAGTLFTFENNLVEDVILGSYTDGVGATVTTSQPVGGLVGTAGGETLAITDCTVRNSVDATDAGAAVFSSLGTDVGGFVGGLQSKYCTINGTHSADLTVETEVTAGIDATIENLNIIGLDASTARGTSVGGLIGSSSGNNCNLNISGVKVRDCVIKTPTTYVGENQSRCGAGGLVGVIATINYVNNTQTEVQFHNILVAKNDITGHSGGGLVGITRTSTAECYNILATDIATRQNNILGQAAGGIYGIDLATGKDRTNSYKNIIVDENKIGAIQSNTYDCIWAGGFVGRVNNSGLSGAFASAKQYFNDVVISDNYIVGYSNTYENIRIGGMFGLLSNGTGGRDFFIYNPIISNNYIGIWNQGADLSVYTMDELKAITKDKVGLLKYDTTINKLTVVDSLPTTMEEKEIQYYATNIGNIAGKMFNSFRVLVLRPEITFDLSATRPVVDCGVAFTQTNNGAAINGNYSIVDSSYPYSYRNLFNVIYFEPQTTASTVGQSVKNVFASTYSQNEDEYLFDEIETIQSTYSAVDNIAANTNDLLDAYRLNLYYTAPNGSQLTMMDVYEKEYYDGSNDATTISEKGVTNDLVGIPMIVYDAQNGTASQVINSFVMMLTNAGGTLNSNISAITKVTAKKAVVNDGVITLASGTSSLTVSGMNVNYNHYDTYSAENGTTITLLEISYGWTTALGEEVRETYYLPVYVLERLDVRSFIRMEEGAVYSYDEMKNSTIGDGTNKHSVIMANDTTYTMAIEFLYGSGRYKFENETVNKVLKLEEATVSGNKVKALPVGTRLTLIDVETGYTYYYEATEENQQPIKNGSKKGIPFTDFVRVPGDNTTAYKVRTMKEVESINPDELQANYVSFDTGNKVYSNVGVERYLLIVDGSNAATENALYDITVVADETQNNNSKDIYPADIINVTSIPGLKVGFEGKGSRTAISGQMMRNEEVLIDAVYGIKAQKLEGQGDEDEAPYWTMASSNEVIDSANNSKYLELAIYLQDKNGNRITLPQNTSVSMNGQILAANGSQSVYYYYKDVGKSESLDGITSDKEWEAQIRLGFETAILDSYNDEYSVVIELLRTDDPAYPMSGDKPDYYGEEITAHIQTDLAVAIKADDLISLGINTYMETIHNYEIPCTSMIDFGSVIEFDLEDGEEVVNKQLTKWCDKTQYQITYRLYKRVNTVDGKEYVPISDERISLWKKDDSAEGGYSAFETTTDSNGWTIYRENRIFSQEEVRRGTGETGGEGLITNNLLLKVDTENITDSELSNYKLEMSIIAYDRLYDADGNEIALNPTGTEAVLQDFFIFTISKLKTDME